MMHLRLGNPLMWDEAHEAAQRLTQAYSLYRQGMSEHATKRFAQKVDLYDCKN
jgi:hypothetical protein